MVCVVVVVRGNNLDRDVDVVAAWLSPFLLEKSCRFRKLYPLGLALKEEDGMIAGDDCHRKTADQKPARLL